MRMFVIPHVDDVSFIGAGEFPCVILEIKLDYLHRLAQALPLFTISETSWNAIYSNVIPNASASYSKPAYQKFD